MPRLSLALLTAALVFVLTYAAAWAAVRSSPTLIFGQKAAFLDVKMRRLGEHLAKYARQHGDYPDSLEQLTASWKGVSPQDAAAEISDSWDTVFQYAKTEKGYRLISSGLDRRAGGVGMYADIEYDGQKFIWPRPTVYQFVFEMAGCAQLFFVASMTSVVASLLWYMAKRPREGRQPIDANKVRLVISLIGTTLAAVFFAWFLAMVHILGSDH